MKRVILNTSIYGMSYDRSTAKMKIASLSNKVEEHILKCIIYGNSTNSYQGWVKELAAWISFVNDVTIKPGKKKLKRKDYEDTLFKCIGDDVADVRLSLLSFQMNFASDRSNEPYREFEIDEYLVKKAYKVLINFKSKIGEILPIRNDLETSEIASIIHSTIDKYCL